MLDMHNMHAYYNNTKMTYLTMTVSFIMNHNYPYI